ncbi:uncharacterized protein LOC131243098 [Magnolia sinica]|uniref:uncharacterized protein LOC131243098 n=1 Tax=Magnolia sinica TaxID=86752 RepID=UPI002658CCB1|nr:uncharacterized protein LOC131243098 [Magnolia sinica]XP_058098178.1 uncharacterized protein LOC131243098 [Magnolia sinica]XP_058098179.1 uncharacterized protein LOC131243098 [Magnolia sinica]
MGKLQYDPMIHHFSHPHPLQLTTPQQAQIKGPCNGCKLQPSGWIYTCIPCNYVLHLHCSQMPQLIHHPSDLNHSLTLLPCPAYPEGFFNCNACGHPGYGFSYHCTPCDLDIHIQCASMPLSLENPAHHHPLTLSFFPPYRNKGFSCDICLNLGSNHWLYRCNACEFDSHLACATAKPKTVVQAQTHQLVALQQQQMVAKAGPGTRFQAQPRTGTQFQSPSTGFVNGCQQQNYYMNDQNTGLSQSADLPMVMMNGPQANQPMIMRNGPQSNQPMMMMMMNGLPQANQPTTMMNGSRNGVVDQAIQGFINSATQQMGQSLVQSFLGGGGGGGSGGDAGGGGGGDSSCNSISVSLDFNTAFESSDSSALE